MSNGINNLYEFGGFRFESESNTLWRYEEMISLPPKALEVLRMLVESEGKLVTKQDILNTVWADTFVEEGVLTQSIYTLRQALGKDEHGKQLIVNIARRGYRFTAPVKILNADEISIAVGQQAKEGFLNDASEILSAEFLENDLKFSSRASAINESPNLTTTQKSLVSSTKPDARPRFARRYAVIIGLGVLILSALGFGIYQFINRSTEKIETKISPIEQVRFQSLTDSGDVLFPTISPNSELLAYVRLDEEQVSVWVKQIATGSSIQTLPPSRRGYASIVFSPDGSHLFFREEAGPGAIYQVPVFGGTPKKVADNVWSDFSVSPDGRQFAFVRRDTERHAHLLILSNIDGSGERELRARQSRVGYGGGSPAWSPDGAKIIVAGGSQQEARPLLLAVDVSTSQETELKTPRWRDITRTLWTPNGKYLIVSARAADESVSQLWMLNFPDGEVRRMTNDLENYFWLSFSADGQKLVTLQQRLASHLWLLPDGDLKKARQLTFGERNHDGYRGLAWTRDGKIVFTSSVGSVTDLYSLNADGSNRVQLTANAGQDNTWPTVSRDGDHIVFTSHRTGGRFIWRMDLDGRNQKQLTPGDGPKENAHSPALSPDGTEVFFIKQAAGPTAIWKVSIEGGAATQVSRFTNASAEDFLSISPDGKWIAFRYVSVQPEAKSEKSTMQIGVLPTDGNAEPKRFELSMRRSMIRWSADTVAFYYSAGTFNSSSLWRQPLDKDNPEKLLDFPDRVFNFAWSQDGKDLVVARGKHLGDAILITNLP